MANDESDPDLDQLDDGWEGSIDDLFKDEEEVEEEPLPDERLDPVAFAEAKKARDERMAEKRARRKAKIEAKKAKILARRAATKGKQKQKQKRAGKPKPEPLADRPSLEEVDPVVSSVARPEIKRATSSPPKGDVVAKGVPWKLLAIVVVVLLAAAAVVAVFASKP